MSHPRNSSDKALKKQQEIGNAAARIFDKKGYLETNMDDIAAGAKTSKGGIYHYFSSKDEILFFILDSYMDIVLKDLESQLQAFQDSTSKLKWIIRRHIDLYVHHMAEAKTLLHDAHCLSPKRCKSIKVKERQYYRIVTEVLSEFFEGRGEIRLEELKAIAFLLFGMCNWTYHWYDPRGVIDPEEFSEITWIVFMKGITERKRCLQK
ncbi:MAG: TetR family transcriptional regulator [Deltaproteobacteria bacterium]|nr:TetR family transcriptional regulator [Deltaproteobacteria bacterium]